jgi:hypothetical protein
LHWHLLWCAGCGCPDSRRVELLYHKEPAMNRRTMLLGSIGAAVVAAVSLVTTKSPYIPSNYAFDYHWAEITNNRGEKRRVVLNARKRLNDGTLNPLSKAIRPGDCFAVYQFDAIDLGRNRIIYRAYREHELET